MVIAAVIAATLAVPGWNVVFGSDQRVSLATDWSHRYMVFSPPRSLMEAFNLSGNPRYVQQWVRRNVERQQWGRPQAFGEIERDWSVSLGAAGATVGAGQYPAKYSFNVTTASCTGDFVIFNTSLAGSATQASIIAYSNLYVGCGGTVPTVTWAYNTGGTISTSVTLSGDGTQVAFVQAQGGVATLVLLKWSASTTETAVLPLTLTAVTPANYRACNAPCMTTITFSGTTPTDTYSSPYYDFTHGSDTLYVGDDTGYLHQFTGVFAGTPAEAGTPWPTQVATVPLSSPVFDSTTGNVFVTTTRQTSNNSGARLDAVCANSTCAGVSNGNKTVAIGTATPTLVLGPTSTAAAACHAPGTSGDGSNLRLDAPIVDSTAGKVYAFVGNDGNGNSAVIQFPTTVGTGTGQFAYHNCGTEATVGTASTTGIPLFAGNLDNVYFTSTGGSPSGNMYVCGNTSGDATMYQLRITANVIAATGTAVLAVSTANTTCSPVAEVYSGTTDWMFISVESLGSTSGTVKCPTSAGCVMSFSMPTTLTGALPTSTTAAMTATGGTSGIGIDNTVAPGTLHTSQIYFSTLGAATAVQASQSGLN
jgi:hypothetical protein